MSFFYDTHGVAGFTYEGETYYYRKNIQGDVIAILNANGVIVATYNYDAWGNWVVTTDANGIGETNPIRYRSYYWDSEFGLYYLQSRYYSPELCRFISQDSIEYLDPESINGINLYAYCLNNPVMLSDATGHMPEWAQGLLAVLGAALIITPLIVAFGAPALIGAVTGALTGGLYGGLTTMSSGGDFWTGFGIGAIGGAVLGAGSGAAATIFAPIFSGSTITFMEALKGILIGVGTGFVGGWGMDVLTQSLIDKKSKIDFFNSPVKSGFQYSFINMLNTFAGATLLPKTGWVGGFSLANDIASGTAYSLLFGILGTAADVIKQYYRRKK